MKIKHFFVISLLLCCFSVLGRTNYRAAGDWIVGKNRLLYNNRPLYLHNTNAFVLAGDKPVWRFAKDESLYGTVFLTYVNEKDEVPLHEFNNIISFYSNGRMRWMLKDSSFPGMEIELEIVCLARDFGVALRIDSKGMPKNACLKWKYGEKKTYPGEHLSWKFDAVGNQEMLTWGIVKEFIAIREGILPAGQISYLKVEMNTEKGLDIESGAKNDFMAAVSKNRELVNRMSIRTPDSNLNAIANSSLAAVDGSWYAPVFVHGCMQWNNPFPGWRTIFGGTMYGWHDRVREQARYYIASQVKDSDKKEAKADPGLLLTGQHGDSRFYGSGRIQQDQAFYDMQTQFFDQLVEEYRWTNDPELIAVLRPALELHLKWMEECFDPDGDGLYESYINCWPTDSQWYNGGGSAEATSYAYKAHQAAKDMALNAHDEEGVKHHEKMLERIKKGFFTRLWIKEKGHSGAYREQGGYQRVHQDPWLYSIFLPIDAGLTSELQNIESLYYPESMLQNDTMVSGGKVVWTSNWVPGAWSIRELWPGDNYHLAWAYFRSGLPEAGWDIMRGAFMHTAYNQNVPGNLGADQGGIDFGDCVHTFSRSLVSGLFGYLPNYPRGLVQINPSFPSDWEYASIELPDFKIDFKKAKRQAVYDICLTNKAAMNLRLPVRAKEVRSVKVDGKKCDFKLEAIPGASLVVLDLPERQNACVEIKYEGEAPCYKPIYKEEAAGSQGMWTVEGDEVIELYDPQGVFEKVSFDEGKIKFLLNDKNGFHTIVARMKHGECEYLKIFRLHVTNKKQEEYESYLNMENTDISGNWNPIDLSAYFNGDIRSIYCQEYLTPRPNTVSVRIGKDGFSPWTFPYWGTRPPQIKLDKVEHYLENNRLLTPQGVMFGWNGYERNVVFSSLWDNYPESATIELGGKQGEAIGFLICGSTNMMQCNIANAEIRIVYEDGSDDIIPLIPPVNYWNLCPIDSHATAPGQHSRSYYTAETDRFCLPKILPRTVELGENCMAMLLTRRLRESSKVKCVTLKCLSQEVVVGLMGVSIK